MAELSLAIAEIAEGPSLDLCDFLDVMQQIGVDDQASLRGYFAKLLSLCDCRDEFSVEKWKGYLLRSYQEYQHQHHSPEEPSAGTLIRHLLQQSAGPIAGETLLALQDELSEYIEDAECLDCQDLIGFCRELLGDDVYPDKDIRIVYRFLVAQQAQQDQAQQDTDTDLEIRVSFLVRFVAQHAYGGHTKDIATLVQSLFDDVLARKDETSCLKISARFCTLRSEARSCRRCASI